VPCFNEELNIISCYEAIHALFENELSKYKLECIFCDNYSTDKTKEILENIALKDARVKVIFNANNFGAMRSLYNGLMQTTGDAVVPFLPADLQDPPEIIPQFVKFWEEGYKVVYGQRTVRDEGFLIKTCRKLYYRSIRKLSKINIPVDAGEFQLIDKQVVASLRKFKDHHPYLRGMIAMTGFKSIGIQYAWKKRDFGHSKTSFLTLVDLALNGFVSTTNFPLRAGMILGLITSTFSVLLAIYGIFSHLYSPEPIASKGVMTIITAIFFFGGVTIFYLSIIAEYIASIHSQVRYRPMVIEERRINFDD
jgi:glycosyltransferase involved in cell wall biosynthesis